VRAAARQLRLGAQSGDGTSADVNLEGTVNFLLLKQKERKKKERKRKSGFWFFFCFFCFFLLDLKNHRLLPGAAGDDAVEDGHVKRNWPLGRGVQRVPVVAPPAKCTIVALSEITALVVFAFA
jgi:hypothetical protein